jgi:hypothetical protein
MIDFDIFCCSGDKRWKGGVLYNKYQHWEQGLATLLLLLFMSPPSQTFLLIILQKQSDPVFTPPNKEQPKQEVPDDPIAYIALGTECVHNGCKAKFEGDRSRVEPCLYHPGAAIFHEGSKYWSCCKRG